MNFSVGRCSLGLAQGPSSVALAWHRAWRSTPVGVFILEMECDGGNTSHAHHLQQKQITVQLLLLRSSTSFCGTAAVAAALEHDRKARTKPIYTHKPAKRFLPRRTC